METAPEIRPEPHEQEQSAAAGPGTSDEGYKPALSNRQVQMIAMGGAIGVGLFYGTGERIAAAGPGLEQSKPLRKMGLHSSPTGELFLSDVRVGRDRLLGDTGESSDSTAVPEGARGGGRESAKANFVTERAGVAAMSLGLIESCLELSIEYAKGRKLWGRPISELQLIQLKLARMEVARLNVQNLVFRHIEMEAAGRSLTLAEASAMKLYSAQAASEVAMEAVQLFGGNGYMSEYRVEQLARDAKVFQIYAGTDEIQVTHIAKDLLSR